MMWSGILISVVLGLVAGSFLNACIYRLPRDLSMVFPPSGCTKCSHRLGPLDLIPLVSYLLLGGRCRYCGQTIPFRYAAVELITAVLFAWTFIEFGFTYSAFFSIVFLLLVTLAAFSDMETQIIPDQVSLIGIPAGLIYNSISGTIVQSVVGMAACAGVMYLIYLAGTRIYKKEAMGGGDIKLAAFFGAFFGWQNGLLCIFLSFLTGAVLSVFYVVLAGKGRRDEMVFGPAMAFAGVVTLFFSGAIWRWYLGI